MNMWMRWCDVMRITRSHKTTPLGNYLHCIALAVAMVINVGGEDITIAFKLLLYLFASTYKNCLGVS